MWIICDILNILVWDYYYLFIYNTMIFKKLFGGGEKMKNKKEGCCDASKGESMGSAGQGKEEMQNTGNSEGAK